MLTSLLRPERLLFLIRYGIQYMGEADSEGKRALRKRILTAEQLEALADSLAEREVVIATEVGGGVVPADQDERRNREAAGRLACLLAARADTVIRVCCGLPRLLKGEELP
jgi:adenosyl cobinamide kinase/adenosyl cobinamide phosphate guanylyltransferase